MHRQALVEPVIILLASIAMAVLAARGQFTSMTAFPWVFGGMALGLGSLTLLRKRRVAPVPRIAIVMLAAGISFAGAFAQQRLVERQHGAAQQIGMTALDGTAAPALAGLLPISGGAAAPTVPTFDGKVTIISFWATWCAPCRRELPELEALYGRLRGRGLQVIAITRLYRGQSQHQAEIEQARQFATQSGLSFPVVVDETAALHKAYRVGPLPTSVLVDGAGRVAAYGVGLNGGREVMRQAREMLGESPP